MGSLTIRNIPEDAKRRFRQVAAAHGRSMEEHVRQLLLQAIAHYAVPSSVREERAGFSPPAEAGPEGGEDWVQELIRLANGAGEGVFDEEPQPLRDFDL
jgi:antitoxin FitA-like protein